VLGDCLELESLMEDTVVLAERTMQTSVLQDELGTQLKRGHEWVIGIDITSVDYAW